MKQKNFLIGNFTVGLTTMIGNGIWLYKKLLSLNTKTTQESGSGKKMLIVIVCFDTWTIEVDSKSQHIA